MVYVSKIAAFDICDLASGIYKFPVFCFTSNQFGTDVLVVVNPRHAETVVSQKFLPHA